MNERTDHERTDATKEDGQIACHRRSLSRIELTGELDMAGAPAVRQAIASALTGRPECVVLDLSRLAFIDSSGLHATIELAQRAAAENVRLVIISGPRAVQRVFDITGLGERLPFMGTQPTGRSAARPRSAQDRAAGSGGRSLLATKRLAAFGRRPGA